MRGPPTSRLRHEKGNRVLAKTLEAARGGLRAAALHARGGLFDGRRGIGSPLLTTRFGQRPFVKSSAHLQVEHPSPHTIGDKRPRHALAPLYRLAWDCAFAAPAIEDLEPEAVAALLRSELLPRLETWRQFELACLLDVAGALASTSRISCVLDASFTSSRPAARIGNLEVWWQRAIQSRPDVDLDEGERKSVNLAASLGVAAGTARVDLTVERAGRVLGIVECKAWRQRESADALLSRSLIALALRGPAPLPSGLGPINCVSLGDLGGAALDPWAHLIVGA